MNFWKNLGIVLASIVALFVVIFIVWIGFFPSGRAVFNNYQNRMQKIDDKTSYQQRKIVEDTCRAMISTYESDKITYELYKSSTSTEKQGWAEQAKLRANSTASTYNNYILQNTYIWKDNIPTDINIKLVLLK